MKQISFSSVIALRLVSAPRLTLAFLLGDGIQVDQPVAIAILTATGIGSGVVLTMGHAVLAHALAVKAHPGRVLWWIEAIAWGLFLVGAPTLVAGLNRSALAIVLYTPQSAWVWAITVVVMVELLVGAAMTASILANESAESVEVQEAPQPAPAAKPSFLARLGAVLIAKVEQVMAPMLEVYRQRPHASLTEVGEQIGRSKATVSEYLNELKKLGKVSVNSQGVQAL